MQKKRWKKGKNGAIMDMRAEDREIYDRNRVVSFVNEHVWPYKKFIVLEEEMKVGGSLMMRCMYKLRVDEKKQSGFWEKWKEEVRKALARKRNNAMEAIKEQMRSK